MSLKCSSCNLNFDTNAHLDNHEQFFCKRDYSASAQAPKAKEIKVDWHDIQTFLNDPKDNAAEALGQMPLSLLRQTLHSDKVESDRIKENLHKSRIRALEQQEAEEKKEASEVAALQATLDAQIQQTLNDIKAQKNLHVKQEFARAKMLDDLQGLDEDTIARMKTTRQKEVDMLKAELRRLQKQDDTLKESIRNQRDVLVQSENQLRKRQIHEEPTAPEDMLVGDARARHDGHPVPLKAVQEIVELTRKRAQTELELQKESEILEKKKTAYQAEAEERNLGGHFDNNDDAIANLIFKIEGSFDQEKQKLNTMRHEYQATLDQIQHIDSHYGSIAPEIVNEQQLPSASVLTELHSKVENNTSLQKKLAHEIHKHWPAKPLQGKHVSPDTATSEQLRPPSEHSLGSHRSSRSGRGSLLSAGASAVRNTPSTKAKPRLPFHVKPPAEKALTAQEYLERGGKDLSMLRQLLDVDQHTDLGKTPSFSGLNGKMRGGSGTGLANGMVGGGSGAGLANGMIGGGSGAGLANGMIGGGSGTGLANGMVGGGSGAGLANGMIGGGSGAGSANGMMGGGFGTGTASGMMGNGATEMRTAVHPMIGNPMLNPIMMNANPMMNPIVNPIMNPAMNPIMNPAMNPIMNPGMHPIMNPAMSPMTNPALSPMMGGMPLQMVPQPHPTMGPAMMQAPSPMWGMPLPPPHTMPPLGGGMPLVHMIPPPGGQQGNAGSNQEKAVEDLSLKKKVASAKEDGHPEQEFLRQLAHQERENLQSLNTFPAESEMYAMKMEHAVEMMKLRSEIEKTMHMKKLDQLKSERDKWLDTKESEKKKVTWLEEQKRSLLETQVKKRLAAQGALKEDLLLGMDLRYEPQTGMVLYWDFILGVPLRFTQCRIAYAFYDGATALGGVKATDMEHGKPDRDAMTMVFAINRKVTHLPVSPTLRLIVEVQYLPSPTKIVSVGWTCVQLFVDGGALNVGKFECPIFRPPPLVTAGESVLEQTERVGNARMFLRIGFPERVTQDTAEKVDSSNVHGYVSPFSFSRSAGTSRPSPCAHERLTPPLSHAPHPVPSFSVEQSSSISAPLSQHSLSLPPHSSAPSKSEDAGQVESPFAVPDSPLFSSDFGSPVQQPSPIQRPSSTTASGKLALQLHGVEEFIPEHPEMVGAVVSSPYTFEVQLLSASGSFAADPWRTREVGAQARSPRNGSDEMVDVAINETHIVEYTKRHAWVVIQVFRIPLGSPMLVAWAYAKTSDADFSKSDVNLSLELFSPPYVDLVALESVDTLHKCPGSLRIALYDPDIRAPTIVTSPKPPTPVEEAPKAFLPHKSVVNDTYYDKNIDGFDLYVDSVRFPPHCALATRMVLKCPNQAWKLCFPAQSCLVDMASPARSVHNINFHYEYRTGTIDPTAVLIIRLDCVDRMLVQQGLGTPLPEPDQYEQAVARAASSPGAPSMRTYGFCVLNLFRKRQEDVQEGQPAWPVTTTDQSYCLNSGDFQLPIAIQPFAKAPKCVPDSLDNAPKLVGASLLLRIRPAPKSADLLRMLSVKTTEQSDWDKVGLALPAPKYGITPTHDTSRITISCAEQAFLKKWEDYFAQGKWDMDKELDVEDEDKDDVHINGTQTEPTIRDAIVKARRKAGQREEVDNNALVTFLMMQFGSIDLHEMSLFDFNRALRWDRQHGFNISIDCVHRIKKDLPVAVVHCLNPPGGLYLDPKLVEDCHFTTVRQWDSSARSPRFPHSWVRYRPSKWEPNMCLVLDVRYIDIKAKHGTGVTPLGWTILPLFDSDGFFQSNSYQLPLIEGAVNTEFLAAVHNARTQHPWKLLLSAVQNPEKGKKPLKLEKFASVFVRACDAQRDTHFMTALDNAHTAYVAPFDTRHYTYDKLGTKILSKLVPKKMTEEEYEKRINMAVASETEITRYVF